MKNLLFIVLGIILGCCVFNYSVLHYNFPKIVKNDTVYIHDTLYLDKNIDSTQLDSIVKSITATKKTFIISVDSVKIDTIGTVINGKLTDQKFKIVFL